MEKPLYTKVLFYTATELTNVQSQNQYQTQAQIEEQYQQSYWSVPKSLASAGNMVQDFVVSESEFSIITKTSSKNLYGVIDTDDDGLKDSDEILAVKGNATSWLKKDTDNDGLDDKMEYVLGYSPVFDDRFGPYSKLFLESVLQYSDLDNDGLTYKQEKEGGFPVTVGCANVGDGGQVTYYFHPWGTHSTNIELGIQIKRYDLFLNPTPVNASYSITVIVNPNCEDEQEETYADEALEGERFKISLGTFDVQQDTLTEVRIEVSVTQPESPKSKSNDLSSIWPFRRLCIWSLALLAPYPNYELFSYKEPANYVEGLTDSTIVDVDDFEISTDPNRPDIFLEIDYLEGHEVEQEVWSETINAFSDAGIMLHYKIDETDIPLDATTNPDDDDDGAETLRNYPEYQDFLDRHKNSELDEYVHMIFAHYIENDALPGWILYGGAFSADTADDISHSGVIFADEAIQEITDTYSTLVERRIKIIVHEIGHVLGASHEKSTGDYHPLIDGDDGTDDMIYYNVMTQDTLHIADANKVLRGDDNLNDRNLGASEIIGFSRFSIESIDQFDLTNKLSVDTGRNIDLLSNYV
jgi:hypothetical protein